MSSQRDPRAYVHDVKEAADAITEFVAGIDALGYAKDDLIRSAVERKFEIVGEALTRLLKTAPDLAHRVSNLSEIIGFRNFLAHGYDSVNHARVWSIIVESLPKLRREIDALAKELGM